MDEGLTDKTFRQFVLVWFGQLISLIGSGLTSFSLGVWVFQHTHSITRFSLILVSAMLPNVIISPFAGVIVDRLNRRVVMLWSDLASGLCTFILASLFFTHQLQIWGIYVLLFLSSAAGAFRFPAYLALLSQMVPLRQIGRASGMMQLGPGAAQVLSPILAAALMSSIGFSGVILIDFLTFLFAIGTLASVHVPTLSSLSDTSRGSPSLWREAGTGWTYIMARSGLVRLLIFFVFVNVTLSFSQALLTPMILGFASTKVLAAIMTTGATGFLAGSILISLWGGPRKKVHGLLVCSILYSVGLSLTGLRPSAQLITLGLFLSAMQIPIMNGCSQAIWQSKTALEMQGRVFGARITIAWLSNPLVYFIAGALADHVLEPLLAVHGPLTQSWLSAIGIGPGRGVALFLILNGVLMLSGAIMSFLNRYFWHVEDDLPDVVALSSGKPAVA
jgi:MFS family permease